MESDRIKTLLDAYFEGTSTLAQEKELRDYFCGSNVAPQLEAYRSMFSAFSEAKKEVSSRVLKVADKPIASQKVWYGIVATVAVLAIVAGFVFSNRGMTKEEKEALAAYKQTKQALQFLSQKLNQGTESLVAINQFTLAKNKILK